MKHLNRIVAITLVSLLLLTSCAAVNAQTNINVNIGIGIGVGDDSDFGLGAMLMLGLGMMALANMHGGGGGAMPSQPQYRRLPPIQIAVAQHASYPSIAILPDEKALYCTMGTMLSLAGTPPDDSYLPPSLVVDRRRVASDHAAFVQGDYLFYWKAMEPGDHLLQVMYTAHDGAAQTTLRTVHVIVAETAPVSLTSVPTLADADTQVPIARVAVAAFKPVRSVIVMDTGDFDLTDDRATLAIPASKMPPGSYSLSVASYASDNTRFVSMCQTIKIQHAASPETAKLAAPANVRTASTSPVQDQTNHASASALPMAAASPPSAVPASLPAPTIAQADADFQAHRWDQAISEYARLIEGGLPSAPPNAVGTIGYAKNRLSLCHEYKGVSARDIGDVSTACSEFRSALTVDASNEDAKRLLTETQRGQEAGR